MVLISLRKKCETNVREQTRERICGVRLRILIVDGMTLSSFTQIFV